MSARRDPLDMSTVSGEPQLDKRALLNRGITQPASTPSRAFLDCLTAELPRLRGMSMIMTRARSDSDDLLQTTAVKAIAAHSHFTMGTNMRAWLYRIMRNAFVDMTRVPDRTATPLENAAEEFFRRDPSQEASMEMRDVLNAIQQLPAIHRDALLLFAVENMSYEHIADLQSCAIGTVKSRIARARRTIQVQLLSDAPQDTVDDNGDQKEKRRAVTSRSRVGDDLADLLF